VVAQSLMGSMDAETKPLSKPSFREAVRFWARLGFINFGGPTAQIAILYQEVVERRRWISHDRFTNALNYCMILPGPEATQLVTFVGWLLHGTVGALVAGILYVLPAAIFLWALSWVYVAYGTVPWLAAIFYGLKAAVIGIVFAAVIRLGKNVLATPALASIAAISFLAFYFLKVPFPLLIGGAALVGFLLRKVAPGMLRRDPGNSSASEMTTPSNPVRHHPLRILTVGVLLWISPVLVAGSIFGWDSIFVRQGLFFGKTALITFGGAYAVLPYVGQHAVEDYGWLSASQMMDGLGLAETTPGPIVLVVQYVGFLGGWNHPPASLSPLAAGTISAAITTWVTFVPSYLFILIGAPFVERLRGQGALSDALSGVTAAVVGVILNLAVWFAMHAIFPDGGGVDLFIAAIALVVFVGMTLRGWGVVPMIAGSGLAGLIYRGIVG